MNIQNEISNYLQRLYSKNLTTSFGGNISIRKDDNIYISETNIDKSKITQDNISILNLNGNILNGITPSSEYMIHQKIYLLKETATSIIHAHPPYATAFALSSESLDSRISSEMYKNLGEIGIADYAKPGSIELAENVSKIAESHNSILMKNHGVLVIAEDISKAYYMIELIEQLAKMTYILKYVGKGNQLSKEDLNDLGVYKNV